MTPELERRIADIRDDRVHGAGLLARQAVLVLGQSISTAGPGSMQLDCLIREAVRALMTAKPTMAPVANLVCRLGYEALEDARAGVATTRRDAETRARALALEAERSVQQSAARAAAAIPDSATVVTCSYSSAVVEALVEAGRAGGSLRVRAARSWDGGTAHGERLAEQLSARGIACDVIPDERVEAATANATLALIGADAVRPDASVVNGHPSLALAQAAARSGIPFYVVCETLKFDARGLLGWREIIEPGFELVPAALITGFYTELGPLDRQEVVQLVPTFRTYLEPFV